MWKPGRDLMKVWCWFAGSDVSLANIESTPHCSRSVKYISSLSFKNCDFSLAPCQVAEPVLCSVYLQLKSSTKVPRFPHLMLPWKPKYFVSETILILFSEEIDLSRAKKSFPKEMLLLQFMAQISSPPNSVTKLDRCLETQAQKAITGVFGTESWWAIIYLNIYNGRRALCL